MTLKKRKTKKKLDDVDPKILKKLKEPKDDFLDTLDEVPLEDVIKEEDTDPDEETT